jgi:hypothetical protein
MFLGHHAIALGSKKIAPQIKLGTLIFAAQFLDLLWPILIIAGVEHVRINSNALPFLRLDLYDYPISHSLFTSLMWSGLIGGAYYLMNKNIRSALIVGSAVFSHWVLDLVSHSPDLPIVPGFATMVGLGLWNLTLVTIFVESGLFIFAIYMYIRSTQAKDRMGMIAPWTLFVFLFISYMASILSPPPPTANPVGWMALAQWLFIPWGYWIDRHRTNKND